MKIPHLALGILFNENILFYIGPNIRQPSPSPALPPHASPGPSNQPTPSPGFMVPSPVNNPASLGSPFPSAASPLAAGSPSMPRPSPRSLQVLEL